MERPMTEQDYLDLIQLYEASGNNDVYLKYLYEQYKRLTGRYPNED